MKFLKQIIAIVSWTLVALSAIFCSLTVFLLYPISILLRDNERHILHRVAVIWARIVIFTFPTWKFEIYGKENLIKNGKSAVYIANHASQVDILTALYLGMRFRFLSKDTLFKIPFMGWAMALIGYVGVKRGNKHSHEKCMKALRNHLLKNTPVFFFPEGTRSKDGVLRQFKTGAFKLASHTNSPIVPISFVGTHKLLPKGSFVPSSSTVQIIIHPAIETANKSDEEIMKNAHIVIRNSLPLEQKGSH